jgi:HAD superfamily hydrolase (TIGR01450 family)
MIAITPEKTQEVHAITEKWRPNINKAYNSSPILVSSIDEIADQFDLILLDAWGVLIDGGDAIPSSIKAVDYLQNSNKLFSVVSNDSTKDNIIFAKAYQDLGFNISQSQVVTSLDNTINFIKSIDDMSSYAVVARPDHHLARQLEQMTFVYNNPEKLLDSKIKNLLFLSAMGWKLQHQQQLIKYAKNKSFDTIAIANPDIGAPYKGQIMATPGYFLADLYQASSCKLNKPVLLGKPGKGIFQYTLGKYPEITDYSKVLMVGDGIYTDILGGNAMGFTTMLISSGLHRNDDIQNILETSKISPDYIAPRL